MRSHFARKAPTHVVFLRRCKVIVSWLVAHETAYDYVLFLDSDACVDRIEGPGLRLRLCR